MYRVELFNWVEESGVSYHEIIDNIENFVKGETANTYAENYASCKDGEENMIAIYEEKEDDMGNFQSILVDKSDNYRI